MLKELFFGSLKESLTIILIIFFLMVIVEFIVLKYKDKIIKYLKKSKFMSYIVSAFFGVIPGCIGTFAMDTLYMSGLLGFGGIISVMVATSGDEAFLIMSMAAKGEISWNIVIMLTLLLFVIGIISGIVADIFRKKTNMKFCERCEIKSHAHVEFKAKHFFKEHIFNHIIKKHIWQIFLWVFVAIFVIGFLQENINIDFSGATMIYMLIMASLIALLPISGPNIVLIVLFAKGIVPFSVLLANSIIQDGHGLLPIMGFSMDDAVKIKAFNFVVGFGLGLILLLFGL